jgi:phytoene dehydrogenase-like protein
MIRAPVTEIVIDNGRATGVRVRLHNSANTVFIPAKRVVSGAGYVNTFTHLVQEAVTQKLGIPRQLSVPQSAGFVMANIGMNLCNSFCVVDLILMLARYDARNAVSS